MRTLTMKPKVGRKWLDTDAVESLPEVVEMVITGIREEGFGARVFYHPVDKFLRWKTSIEYTDYQLRELMDLMKVTRPKSLIGRSIIVGLTVEEGRIFGSKYQLIDEDTAVG